MSRSHPQFIFKYWSLKSQSAVCQTLTRANFPLLPSQLSKWALLNHIVLKLLTLSKRVQMWLRISSRASARDITRLRSLRCYINLQKCRPRTRSDVLHFSKCSTVWTLHGPLHSRLTVRRWYSWPSICLVYPYSQNSCSCRVQKTHGIARCSCLKFKTQRAGSSYYLRFRFPPCGLSLELAPNAVEVFS